MRLLIAVHRYLGIAIGWLVAMWCLSGIVMIYVPYPEVTLEERVEALPLLDLRHCCTVPASSEWLLELEARDFSIRMRQDRPILSVVDDFGDSLQIALDSGEPLGDVSAAEALAIADARTAHWPGRGTVRYLGATVRDQWTVGDFRPDRTLHHVALGDSAHTEWYLDSRNGELVQATTAVERTWNRFGAVVHWLYPTPLRARGPVWANIVIWTTIVALFLTVVGLWIGIARLRLRRGSRLSPYRGLALWHHTLGLGAGILTLTWLFSGLVSMNPWGFLAGSGPREEVSRLQGEPLTVAELVDGLRRLPDASLPDGTTYLSAAPLLDELYLVAYDRKGRRSRLDAKTLAQAPLEPADLAAASARLLPGASIASAELMQEPDAYYYDRGIANGWPVYRIRYDDAEHTRYYLDAQTGELLARIDSNRSAYRWLFTALHSLDFSSLVRVRPVWDVLIVVLLLGVAAVSGTGTWLGCRYLRRTFGRQ